MYRENGISFFPAFATASLKFLSTAGISRAYIISIGSTRAIGRGANMASDHGKWTIPSHGSIENLKYTTSEEVTDSLGPLEIKVKMRAASLNYRELAIVEGRPPTNARQGVVPGSDGAGVVEAIGSSVSRFEPGDEVIMHMIPDASFDDDALPLMSDVCAGLGETVDGTLRETAIFSEAALIPKPSTMSFEQAATLGCSGLTAWNALMGIKDRRPKRGDWVLVQGTGGVSIAALQIAIASGASVVATTSSDAKAERLRSLGATHVVNYREHKDWGTVAKSQTPDQKGFDIVVDVGGNATLSHSLEAARTDGVVSLVGVLAGEGEQGVVPMMAALWHSCIVRGLFLGSRNMFREFVLFCDSTELRPALDDVAFPLADAKKAYERLRKQEHYSKVVIKIP